MGLSGTFWARQHEPMKPFSLLVLLFATSSFASSVAITTTTVPNGIVGTAYSAVIKASGGCTPYVWAMSGTLPAGVTAKPSSNTTSLNFTGTPKTAGTYSFTEQVTGCGGVHSKVSYKIVVQATANHVVDLSWKPSPTTNVVGYNGLPRSGWGDLEEDQCQPDRIVALFRFDRRQQNHLLLLGNGHRRQRQGEYQGTRGESCDSLMCSVS